tara:strand:+ start:64 stop:528 length:465 start_codon:yes stop_codon:yes gene_type:complete
MTYIGQEPLQGEYIKLDSISVTATDTFALQRNGAAFAPGTAQQCIVSVNGVTQAPIDAFSISGSNIVFTESLNANDVIDYVLVMGNALSTGVPSDGSIQGSKLSSTLFRDPLRINDSNISSNITIASGERAMVAGDITIDSGKTLTVNGVLTIV